MASDSADFDLSAAWYRKAQGDLKAFMEAFATRMKGAIPGRVKVERRRDRFFAKTSHVVTVAIDTGPNLYRLCLDDNHLSAQRAKIVRGVTLKSEALALPEWLNALSEDMERLAERAGAAQEALHGFLTS